MHELSLSQRPARAFVAVGLCWGSFAALVPVLKAETGASDAVFGLVLLAGAVSACVSMLSTPAMARALGWARMVVPMFIMAVAAVILGLSGSIAGFALIFMILTAGSASLDVTMNTELSGIEAREKAGLMGLNHALFSFSYAFAAMMTGLAREAGFQPVHIWLVMFGVCMVLAPGMRAVALPPKSANPTAMRLPWGMVFLVGAVMFIGLQAEISVEQWSALYLERDLGGSAAAGALGPALLGVTMGVGRLSGQILTRRMDEVGLIRIAGFVSAVGMVLVATASGVWSAYAGFILFGLGVSVSFPMGLAIAGRAVDDARRSLMISRVSFVGYTGFFVGPPVMGLVAEYFGLNASFALVAVLLLIMAGPLCATLARPR